MALPLQEDLVVTARGPLHLLLLAVGLVLLVASVNVANLVLVRSTGRVHEFAVRSALGSGRGRLARQLLVESLLLAVLGGLLGLVLAGAGVEVLRGLGRDALPRIDEVGFDPLVLGFRLADTSSPPLPSVSRRRCVSPASPRSRRCVSSRAPPPAPAVRDGSAAAWPPRSSRWR